MRTIHAAVAIIISIVLSSCVHRTFEWESVVYVDVVFDWQNDPEAQPVSMMLYMFPAEGGEPLRYEFAGRDGGTIRLDPGIYDAICVNSDTRNVYYRGDRSHSTFEVTTTEARTLTFGSALSVLSYDLPRAPGAEDQSLATQPPLLWSASETAFKVNITHGTKSRGEKQELRMYPARIVDTYEVKVKNIRNVEHLSALSATIINMSDGYLAGQTIHNDGAVTIPLELYHDPEAATAQGRFLTFGHCPASEREHKLMVYAILKDGSKYYYEFDVSRQAHNPPDDNNIHHIVVECLELPEPIGGGDTGGGFDPTVDEWKNVDIGIEM